MQDDVVNLVLRKLSSRAPLSDADRAAIAALQFTPRSLETGGYVVREGEAVSRSSIVLSGFLFRNKLTMDGSRQILSVHMRGDFADLQNLFLNTSDHNVQAFTRARIAAVDSAALQQACFDNPGIARAMWIDALIDAAIFREWTVNVGRRGARARIAHLLCEVAIRMEFAGLGMTRQYELPMTQEQIGDATGLTSVHVNRTLKGLRLDGLIHRSGRLISIRNWEELCGVADFNAGYLHLDQSAPLG